MNSTSVRRRSILLPLTGLALFLSPGISADTLNDILTRMDKTAPSFRSVSASMKRIDFTAVLKDTSEERGTMRLKRTGKQVQGVVDITSPEAKAYGFRDKQAQIYYPKINTVEIYDIGKFKDQVNEYLTLGFGSSGKELSKNYNVTLAGAETIDGVKTTRLDLKPKTPQELIQRLEMWIPEGAAYAIQQKVHLKGGDYKLLVYSDVKINPALSDQQFELKVPKNAKKEHRGK